MMEFADVAAAAARGERIGVAVVFALYVSLLEIYSFDNNCVNVTLKRVPLKMSF